MHINHLREQVACYAQTSREQPAQYDPTLQAGYLTMVHSALLVTKRGDGVGDAELEQHGLL